MDVSCTTFQGDVVLELLEVSLIGSGSLRRLPRGTSKPIAANAVPGLLGGVRGSVRPYGVGLNAVFFLPVLSSMVTGNAADKL